MSPVLQQAALWTWQNSLAAAALALAIMGLRRVFQRISPLWLCLAGWLVLVRLLLPAPLPHAWGWDRAWTVAPPTFAQEKPAVVPPAGSVSDAGGYSVAELQEEIAAVRTTLGRLSEAGHGSLSPDALVSSEIIVREPVPVVPLAASSEPAQASRIDWLSIALWVWMAGTAGCLIHTLIRHRRFHRQLARTTKPVDLPWPGLAAECATTAGLRRVPPLFTVPGSGTPFLCGLFRPRIILPAGTLEVLTPAEARHVLLHEMLHIRRWDLAANWLLAAARALHWFNPLIHLTCRRLLADRELLRDHQAIALLSDPSERAAYGHTLLKLALPLSAPAPSPGLAPFFRSEKELKRRLTMIQSPLHQHRLTAALASITLTALSTVLFTTARGQEKPAPAKVPATPAPAEAVSPVAPAALPAPAVPATPATSVAPAFPATPALPVTPATPRIPATGEVPASAAGAAAGELPPSTTPRAASAAAGEPPELESPGKTPGPATSKKPPKNASGLPSATPAPAKTKTAATGKLPPEKLRSMADQLRRNGQTEMAETIEELLKRYPAADDIAPMLQAAQVTPAATELQQLRAEMAELKAAVASLKRHVAPEDLQSELAELKAQLKHLGAAGLGVRHPKVAALKQGIESANERIEATEKIARAKSAAELDSLSKSLAEVARNREELMKSALAQKEDAARQKDLEARLKMETIREMELRKTMDEVKRAEAMKRYSDEIEKAKLGLLEKAGEESKARRAEAVKDTDQAGENLPWGVAVPGKKGLVYSPYTEERTIVDVSGFEKRSKVKCPYSGNFFRVP